MLNDLHSLCLIALFAPLAACLIAGLGQKQVGRVGAATVTIAGVAIAFMASLLIAKIILFDNITGSNWSLYTWVLSGIYSFKVSFLIDHLSCLMMLTVTFVSLLVHIYSIGYMHDDAGFQRFFSYISLFTFFMLLLVLASNFLVLFVGWEGVGLVSYLLIGFWYQKESAVVGSLKAFLVNRVGDFGFVLGLGAILAYFGSLDYATVFGMVTTVNAAQHMVTILPGMQVHLIPLICFLLFIGASGKSAQVPLHVWLPESMEGPTPISALIHAATMVTAGVYLIARMSPLFEHAPAVLSLILVIGATGALFLGLVGVVQHDIKRVVAYSTLSQLGYMVVACGASAFSAALFHLFTHACFKALLFLAAGSVIIGMHHDQDMRNMGGLRKYMPITYVCFLIGSLSLSAMPPFAGFFSKDSIIDAVKHAHIAGASYAYVCVLIGSFVTALYSFRALFLTFHGKERMSDEARAHLQESPFSVCLPLVVLAIPSVILGWPMIGPMLFQPHGLLGNSVHVAAQFNVLKLMAHEYHGPFNMIVEALHNLPFWFAVLGILTAWFAYIKKPCLPQKFAKRFHWLYQALCNKFGFDALYQRVFVLGARRLGEFFYTVTDQSVIDGKVVNGSGQLIRLISRITRRWQSGYLYHYVLAMMVGLVIFLAWLIIFLPKFVR